jgi:LysM repeat protein
MRRATVIGLVWVLLMLLAPGGASAQGIGRTHVVQRGENLFRIALRYGVSVQAIATINGIVNPAMIYVGQPLVIPAGANTSVPSTPTPAPATPDANVSASPTPTLVSATPDANASASPAPTLAPATPDATFAPITAALPMSPTVAATPAPSQTVTPAPVMTPVVANAARTHVVAAGENLFRIALRYGLTTGELAAANGISNFNSVYVGQVLRIPAPGQPAGPVRTPGQAAGAGKRIVVSISRQHLWAYDGEREVYSFVASTGLATSPTKTGTYRVLDKIPNAYASTWNLQMPYWLGIYYVGRIENGIHALPILSSGQTLWSGYLGRPVSFGCIVLDTQAAAKLYEWADVGTTVVIQP